MLWGVQATPRSGGLLRNSPATTYDSAVTMNYSQQGMPPVEHGSIQPALLTATLVEETDEQMKERLQKELEEREQIMIREIAEREARLRQKEEEIARDLREREEQLAQRSLQLEANAAPVAQVRVVSTPKIGMHTACATPATVPNGSSTYASSTLTPSVGTSGSIESNRTMQELSLPMFEKSEVHFGKLISTGNFNSVFDLKSIRLNSQLYWWAHNEHSHNRKLLADSSRKQRMSIKMVKTGLNPKKQCLAQKRIIYEARLLAKLNHANVGSLIGISAPDTPEQNFFFLTHHIHETLYTCINKSWNKRHRGKPKMLLHQAQTANDVASALSYLHSQNIMYSDLKPEVRWGR